MSELTAEEQQKSNELQSQELPKQEDNLVMADRMIDQLRIPFYEALEKLSRKETNKLLKLLVQFPFVDVNKFKLNDKQKYAFMFGERLVYANMVKRARAELDRTFGEVRNELETIQTEETKKEVDEKVLD